MDSDFTDLIKILSESEIPEGLLNDPKRIDILYRDMNRVSAFVGKNIADLIWEGKEQPFKFYFSLSKSLWQDDRIDLVIVNKMAATAKTAKHVRAIFQTVYEWKNEYGTMDRDHIKTAAECLLLNTKVPHKAWIEINDYYKATSSGGGTPEDMPYGMPPIFKSVLIERAITTAKSSEEIIAFCSSRAATNRETQVLRTLRKIVDWPTEMWWATADSTLSGNIKKLAWDKIEDKRSLEKNKKL